MEHILGTTASAPIDVDMNNFVSSGLSMMSGKGIKTEES